tara:strand:- start:146 stop:448 length:303 start_codon:yes stop_codon:yes gene_type:complete
MIYLPNDIINHIYSFLPIVSNEKKILNTLIQNYKYYFIQELFKLYMIHDINNILNIWIKIYPEYEKYCNDIISYDFTLLQIQKFYTFMVSYSTILGIQTL